MKKYSCLFLIGRGTVWVRTPPLPNNTNGLVGWGHAKGRQASDKVSVRGREGKRVNQAGTTGVGRISCVGGFLVQMP